MSATRVVLDPGGYPPTVSAQQLAPRLETLDGKTVFLVDCQFENSGPFLAQVEAWFAEHLPTVSTPTVRWRGEIYLAEDRETLEEVAANGDAAILAVGL